MKIPESLGACADRLYELKAEKSAAQKVVEAIEAEETAIKNYIIDELPKSNASGIAGTKARVTVVTKPVPRATDWMEVYNFILRNDRFDLLQRRLSDAAVKEMWQDGQSVPGVEPFNVITVSINKV